MIPFLYNLVAHALLLPVSPVVYAWARRRRPRFREALPQRLGRTAGLPRPPLRAPLWLHGVSLGEVRALRPLVAAWRREHPACPVLISSSTETGLDAAHALYPDASVTPFPLDTPLAVNALLEYWRPGCVGLLETELWPNFFWACARRQIPVCVISGRISQRTYRRGRPLRGLWRNVLAAGTAFGMQTEADAHRLRAMGAPVDRVQVLGNLKWASATPPAPHAAVAWRRTWGVTPDVPLLVWGSTHAPEERLALQTWCQLRASMPGLRLVVVPRHPERFDAVARELDGPGIRLHRRSAGPVADWDLLVLDTVGELTTAYAAATVAVMGGTFAPVGGHNILEPIAAGTPLIVGPWTGRIRDLADAACAADAVAVAEADTLAEALWTLLEQPGRRATLTANGRQLLAAHRDTAERTVALLEAAWPLADAGCRR